MKTQHQGVFSRSIISRHNGKATTLVCLMGVFLTILPNVHSGEQGTKRKSGDEVQMAKETKDQRNLQITSLA